MVGLRGKVWLLLLMFSISDFGFLDGLTYFKYRA